MHVVKSEVAANARTDALVTRTAADAEVVVLACGMIEELRRREN
jgi:hypothetical protein